MAKKPTMPIKFTWTFNGITTNEPPDWVRKHISDVMAGIKSNHMKGA